MIQDIQPRQYHCEYQDLKPEENDGVLTYEPDAVHVYLQDDGSLVIPTWRQMQSVPGTCRYLFSVDSRRYFLLQCDKVPDSLNLSSVPVAGLRNTSPEWISYVCITGHQLYLWYTGNRYCSQCQGELAHSDTERALVCHRCNQVIYPKISPAVIVGVIDKDRILLTRYAGRVRPNHALVAGFCEIGESLEDTVHREVLEETGVRVKNIRYYKSQPWSFSSSLLIGMFADADGTQVPVPDGVELEEAAWHGREDIEPAAHPVSLTAEMIQYFRRNFQEEEN